MSREVQARGHHHREHQEIAPAQAATAQGREVPQFPLQGGPGITLRWLCQGVAVQGWLCHYSQSLLHPLSLSLPIWLEWKSWERWQWGWPGTLANVTEPLNHPEITSTSPNPALVPLLWDERALPPSHIPLPGNWFIPTSGAARGALSALISIFWVRLSPAPPPHPLLGCSSPTSKAAGHGAFPTAQPGCVPPCWGDPAVPPQPSTMRWQEELSPEPHELPPEPLSACSTRNQPQDSHGLCNHWEPSWLAGFEPHPLKAAAAAGCEFLQSTSATPRAASQKPTERVRLSQTSHPKPSPELQGGS